MKTKVVHSKSKLTWNIIGTKLGAKFKVARCPYIKIEGCEKTSTREKAAALDIAEFISKSLEVYHVRKGEQRTGLRCDHCGGEILDFQKVLHEGCVELRGVPVDGEPSQRPYVDTDCDETPPDGEQKEIIHTKCDKRIEECECADATVKIVEEQEE